MQKVLSLLITSLSWCFRESCKGAMEAQDKPRMFIQSQDLRFTESELLGL